MRKPFPRSRSPRGNAECDDATIPALNTAGAGRISVARIRPHQHVQHHPDDDQGRADEKQALDDERRVDRNFGVHNSTYDSILLQAPV